MKITNELTIVTLLVVLGVASGLVIDRERSLSKEYLKQANLVEQHLEEYKHKTEVLTTKYNDLEKSHKQLINKYHEVTKDPVLEVLDISIPSGANLTHIENALAETELIDLSSTFIEAEKKYSINAYILMGIVALESSWGKSDIAINQNNLTGYAVYDYDPTGKVFNSKEDSILATAELLDNHYLKVDGDYYTGSNLHDVGVRYSSDKDWSKKVSTIALDLLTKTIHGGTK